MKPKFSIEECEPPPEPVPPEGGWKRVLCTFASHSWSLEVENGRVGLNCTDPCDGRLFNPLGLTPVCLYPWEPEDLFAESIPVTVTHINDSTPSTPSGPAEYSYYLEVRPKENE